MKQSFLICACLFCTAFLSCTDNVDNEFTEITNNQEKNSASTILSDAKIMEITNMLSDISPNTRGNCLEVKEVLPVFAGDSSYSIEELDTLSLDPYVTVGAVINYKADNGYVVVNNNVSDPTVIKVSTSGNLSSSYLSESGLPDILVADVLVKPADVINPYEEDSDEDLPAAVDSNPIASVKVIRRDTTQWITVRKMAPLLDEANIHYKQTSPYNMHSPYTSSGPIFANTHGERLKAGCAPVAYAQVMAYHNVPDIDWNTAESIDEEINEVAPLIREIGKQLHAQYHGDGTFVSPYSRDEVRSIAAYTNYIPFIDFTADLFNDDMSVPFKKQGYSEPGDWNNYNEEDILEDLDNRLPVIALGMDEGYKYFQNFTMKKLYINGHYFVLDGYLLRQRSITKRSGSKVLETKVETELLFHCNMGNGSYNDGFYNSRLFDVNEGPVTRNIFKKIGGFITDLFKEAIDWSIDKILRLINTPPIPLGQTGEAGEYTHHLRILSGIKP